MKNCRLLIADCRNAGARRTASVVGFTMVEMLIVIGIIIILMGIAVVVSPQVLGLGKESRLKLMFQSLGSAADEYRANTRQNVNHLDDTGVNPAGDDPRDADVTTDDAFDWDTSGRVGYNCLYNTPGAPNSNGRIIPNSPPDETTNPVIECSIERFVWATMRETGIKELYASFDPRELTDTDGTNDYDDDEKLTEDGFLEIRDPWKNKIIYVSNVIDDNAEDAEMEYDNFLRQYPKPYFVSAGPDGEWGTWDNDDNVPGTTDVGSVLWDANSDDEPDSADNIYSIEANQ